MAIVLEETTDIHGGGKEAHLRWLAEEWSPFLERTRGVRLLWVGSTIGSTARWPETIAVWEMRDWDHWAEACARVDPEGGDDPELRRLWESAAKLRRGSRRRTLVGSDFSPTLDVLRSEGVSGTVFAFADYRVRPGRMRAFLVRLRERAARDAAEGRRLVGAFEVAFTNDSAAAIWAHRTIADLAAWQSRGGGDAGGDVEEWRERWGYASPGSPLWPPDLPAGGRLW